MNKDGVEAAFELISEEIEAVANDVAEQGSKAFRDRAYDTAQRLGETGKSLQDFRKRVEELLADWLRGIDIPTRQRFATLRLQELIQDSVERSKPIAQTHRTDIQRGAWTRLRVTFKDGTTFEEHKAADTFALAIHHIGLPRVEALGIKVRMLQLVGDKRSNRYNQRRIDGRYICIHSATQEKKKILEDISGRLAIPLDVQIIENI